MVKNWKFRGGGGAYVKFPPWLGYGYFLKLHNITSAQPKYHQLKMPLTVPLHKREVSNKGNREFKQITTAGATMAAVTEKVWGEYVASVCQILQSEIQRCQEHELRSSKSLLFCFL